MPASSRPVGEKETKRKQIKKRLHRYTTIGFLRGEPNRGIGQAESHGQCLVVRGHGVPLSPLSVSAAWPGLPLPPWLFRADKPFPFLCGRRIAPDLFTGRYVEPSERLRPAVGRAPRSTRRPGISVGKAPEVKEWQLRHRLLAPRHRAGKAEAYLSAGNDEPWAAESLGGDLMPANMRAVIDRQIETPAETALGWTGRHAAGRSSASGFQPRAVCGRWSGKPPS